MEKLSLIPQGSVPHSSGICILQRASLEALLYIYTAVYQEKLYAKQRATYNLYAARRTVGVPPDCPQMVGKGTLNRDQPEGQ